MDGSTLPTKNVEDLLVQSVRSEHGFTPLRVEGTLPPSLTGTLYRTGPALFEVFGKRVSHIFEADGGISATRFSGGRAEGAYRIIESEGRRRELRTKRMEYGFAAPWHKRMRAALAGDVKNTGNTNVFFHQGKLYALMEGAIPTEIHPDSLATLGETRFGKTIKGAFSAHPHYVPARRTTYNFGMRYGRETCLDVYALPDAGTPTCIASVPVPAVMLHDFIATESHLVFFIAPLRVSVWRALLQVGTFGDLFRWVPEKGTEVIAVPIDRPEAVRRFTVDAFYQWHFANAFEENGSIVVDFVRYADASSLTSIGDADIAEGALVRARLGRERDTLTFETLEASNGDFPIVDPRYMGKPHDVVFRTLDEKRGRGLSRFDLARGEATFFRDEATRAYSEGVFVPKHAGAREGEGHLLSLVLDARTETSHVAVFDAERLAEGPVARAFFDHAIPMTFHGTFVSG